MLAAPDAIPVWTWCRLVDALTASDHASACLDAIRAGAAGGCHTSDAHVHYDAARITVTAPGQPPVRVSWGQVLAFITPAVTGRLDEWERAVARGRHTDPPARRAELDALRDATIFDTQDGTLDQPSLFDTDDLDTTPAPTSGPSTDARGETAPRPRWFFEHLLTTAEAFQLADTGRPVTNPFAQRTRDDNDADVTRLRAELAIIDHHDTPTVRSGRTRPRPWRAEPVT